MLTIKVLRDDTGRVPCDSQVWAIQQRAATTECATMVGKSDKCYTQQRALKVNCGNHETDDKKFF